MSSHHQVTPPHALDISTKEEAKEVLLLYRHVAHDSPPARGTFMFQEQRGKNNTKSEKSHTT
eukprot:12362701-Ditylum_brightwellii.AAC.1